MQLPPGVRIELFPEWFGGPATSDGPAVLNGDVLYVTPAQSFRLDMGESITILDLRKFAAESAFYRPAH